MEGNDIANKFLKERNPKMISRNFYKEIPNQNSLEQAPQKSFMHEPEEENIPSTTNYLEKRMKIHAERQALERKIQLESSFDAFVPSQGTVKQIKNKDLTNLPPS